jgi:hypothetical protein
MSLAIVIFIVLLAGLPVLFVWLVSPRLPALHRGVLVMCIAVAAVSFVFCLNFSMGASAMIGVADPAVQKRLWWYGHLSWAAFGICVLSLVVFLATSIRGIWISRSLRAV